MRGLVRGADSLVARLESVLLVLAGVAVGLTALVVTGAAFARYAFGSPIAGANELVTIYLGPAITFLAISAALRSGSHIAVSIVARYLPRSLMRVATVGVYLLSLVAFAILTWEIGERALEAWRENEVVFGSRTWPLYPGYALVAVGAGLLVVRHVIVIAAAIWDPERSPAAVEEDQASSPA